MDGIWKEGVLTQ